MSAQHEWWSEGPIADLGRRAAPLAAAPQHHLASPMRAVLLVGGCVMELDPVKLGKARRAKWKAEHVAGADGKCVRCGRTSPCLFATAGSISRVSDNE